jgi:uncharacterized membrane protein
VKRLGRRVLLLLAVAAAVHLLAVWATPRLVMHRLTAAVLPGERSGVVLPPATDHTQRRVVMPSPDLLYAACALDLSERPMRIRADLRTPHYSSIALYAANSDNFFVVNDLQARSRLVDDAQGRPADGDDGPRVDLVLLGPKPYAQAPAMPPGARTVTAPSAKGLLLMRVLVADAATDLPAADAARATLRCEPL